MKKNIAIFIFVAGVSVVLLLSGLPFGKITKYFGMMAGGSLYMSLFVGMSVRIAQVLEKFAVVRSAPRFFGVTALAFGLIHGGCAFFGQFGGFGGLGFLPVSYLRAIFFGLSLIVIMLFAFFWQKVRVLLYFSGTFLLVHMLLIGSDFVSLHTLIARIAFVALSILLLLEAHAFDLYVNKKFVCVSVVMFFVGVLSTHFFAGDGKNIFSIHGQHSADMTMQTMGMAMPEVKNERRYTVSFLHPDTVPVGKTVAMRFVVFDANTGAQIDLFSIGYEKLMHMIVVDESLNYFSHIHPTFDPETGFSIETSFPHAGRYHIYTNFMPLGEKLEQQFGFSVQVGTHSDSEPTVVSSDAQQNLFDGYTVRWTADGSFSAVRMSAGQQQIKYHIEKDSQPFTDIRPYLAAFGHLTMIHTQTFAFVHVHPKQTDRVSGSMTSGPDVEFLPMSYYSAIAPGEYVMFGEFNLGGKVVTTRFLVHIEP